MEASENQQSELIFLVAGVYLLILGVAGGAFNILAFIYAIKVNRLA
jgi:hypothetical protein